MSRFASQKRAEPASSILEAVASSESAATSEEGRETEADDRRLVDNWIQIAVGTASVDDLKTEISCLSEASRRTILEAVLDHPSQAINVPEPDASGSLNDQRKNMGAQETVKGKVVGPPMPKITELKARRKKRRLDQKALKRASTQDAPTEQKGQKVKDRRRKEERVRRRADGSTNS